MRQEIQELTEAIVDLLDSKKAEDIQLFDLHDKEYISDMVILCTTLGEKHTVALLDYLSSFLKERGVLVLAIEEGEAWTVVDTGDILIHLMIPEYRARYQIEEIFDTLPARYVAP